MPSGSLVTLVSIRLCSVSAICLYPLTAESSCEVTELQLHLRCSCKRKLLFLTMVLNIHCWFVLKEHYQNLKLWVMSASFMFLNFVCVFRHRPPPPPLMLSFGLSLWTSSFFCLILWPFALFAEARVKWSWVRLLTHLLSTTTSTAASLTCIIEHAAEQPKGKTPGKSHSCCSGQIIFKLGFWDRKGQKK